MITRHTDISKPMAISWPRWARDKVSPLGEPLEIYPQSTEGDAFGVKTQGTGAR